jgi:Gas vesicle protein G
MGLLKGLLLLPLAPVQGVSWLSNVLLDAAERELHDPAVLRARLAELNRAYDAGEIDTQSFEQAEEKLLDLLEGPAPWLPTAHHPGGAH